MLGKFNTAIVSVPVYDPCSRLRKLSLLNKERISLTQFLTIHQIKYILSLNDYSTTSVLSKGGVG